MTMFGKWAVVGGPLGKGGKALYTRCGLKREPARLP